MCFDWNRIVPLKQVNYSTFPHIQLKKMYDFLSF